MIKRFKDFKVWQLARVLVKEFINFLFIAKGSCGELRSHFYISYDLDYIDKKTFYNLKDQTITISKSLSGFIEYLSTSSITK